MIIVVHLCSLLWITLWHMHLHGLGPDTHLLIYMVSSYYCVSLLCKDVGVCVCVSIIVSWPHHTRNEAHVTLLPSASFVCNTDIYRQLNGKCSNVH